jgi:hypothetical protein
VDDELNCVYITTPAPMLLASEGDTLTEDYTNGNWIPFAAALCSIPIFFGLVRLNCELIIACSVRLGAFSIIKHLINLGSITFSHSGNNCADHWNSSRSVHTTSFHHISLG